MPYFSPAVLYRSPYTLPAKQSLTLKYRLLQPGSWNRDAVERAWQEIWLANRGEMAGTARRVSHADRGGSPMLLGADLLSARVSHAAGRAPTPPTPHEAVSFRPLPRQPSVVTAVRAPEIRWTTGVPRSDRKTPANSRRPARMASGSRSAPGHPAARDSGARKARLHRGVSLPLPCPGYKMASVDAAAVRRGRQVGGLLIARPPSAWRGSMSWAVRLVVAGLVLPLVWVGSASRRAA